jgi:hypothetical protein
MPDFKDLAERAKANHEARVAERTRKTAEERELRKQRAEAAINQLSTEVIPALEKARAQFGHSGVHSHIQNDFDVLNYIGKLPSVLFQFVRSEGETGDRGLPVFFESDGETIEAGIGEHCFSHHSERSLGKAPPMNLDLLITNAVKEAIESYYKELERS